MLILMRLLLHFCLLLVLLSGKIAAQCISSFPYREDFESSRGSWTSGGTANDWDWGVPQKAVIGSAASGQRCWVAGGLSGSFYNLGERSWVESPCFDLSSLAAPYFECSVFWETERNFDGASLQYSINNGSSWQNVGGTGPSDCLRQNWFNTQAITNLGNLSGLREGWSGNIQNSSGSCLGGNGSGQWLRATHCLSQIPAAQRGNVRFRFIFGAGTTCNDYDGFAFDDIFIGEAPTSTPGFSYSCQGIRVRLQANSTSCPDSFSWQIVSPKADLQSFSGDTATALLDTAGSYVLELRAYGPCGRRDTLRSSIVARSFSTAARPLRCFGIPEGGAIALNPGGWSFQWAGNPPQIADSISGLEAGIYSVTAFPDTGCGSVQKIEVNSPSALISSWTATADTCSRRTGTLAADGSGGTGPYQFYWSTGDSIPILSGLIGGSYPFTIRDAQACESSDTAFVVLISGIRPEALMLSPAACLQQNGILLGRAEGGTEPYRWFWSSGSTDSIAEGLGPGLYRLRITDFNGCTDSVAVRLEAEDCPQDVFLPTAFSPNADGSNDLFRPLFYRAPKRIQWKVYNRWGQEVFSGSGSDAWDGSYAGRECEQGVYVWYLDLQESDGVRKLLRGNVTLMR